MATQTAKSQTAESRSSAPDARRSKGPESVLRPPVDIQETDGALILRADMPGVARDRLEVRVDGNTLLIEGTIGVAPQDQMAALFADVRSTTYRRQFALSNELESSRIEANLQ